MTDEIAKSALALAIARAWMDNPDRVYPPGASDCDVQAMAEVAAEVCTGALAKPEVKA